MTRIVLFLETFTALGYELGQATMHMKRLWSNCSGSTNVLRQTEMLRGLLGSKAKKDLREKSGLRSLAERAEEEEVIS